MAKSDKPINDFIKGLNKLDKKSVNRKFSTPTFNAIVTLAFKLEKDLKEYYNG